MGRKCCCQKLPCCCGNSPTEWVVDLDIGGWTDARCDMCNEVSGEFVLVHNTTITGHELTCLFAYVVLDWCVDSLAEDCGLDPGAEEDITLTIILRIPLMNEFTTTCTITLSVEVTQDLGEDGFCTAKCIVQYSGTFTKADYDGCFDEDFVPFTLTRDSEACTANNSLGLLCGGGGNAMPATVDIWPNV